MNMKLSEDTKHDLFLVIVSMIFIIFALGCERGPDTLFDQPIVLPTI